MTNLARLPTWAGDELVHVVVETPRGARAKLTFDPELKTFVLSKALNARPVLSLRLGLHSVDPSRRRRSARRHGHSRRGHHAGARAALQDHRRPSNDSKNQAHPNPQ